MSDRTYVDTCVGRLAVMSVGTGAPALLWHSLFVDERSWQRVTPQLAEDRRLIVITGPGHGSSSDPGRRYSLQDCAGAAATVLDSQGVRDPVDWVGNAWGGHVGVLFAAAHPQRTRSLVTIGTPVQELSRSERVRMHVLLGAHRVLGPARFITDAVVDTMLSPATRGCDPDAVALVHDSFTDADPRRLRNAVVSISLGRESLASVLPIVSAPTLMITGADHSGWTPSQAAAAVTALPDGRVAVVPDAAYLVPLEQPAAVVDHVRAFWARTAAETSDRRR